MGGRWGCCPRTSPAATGFLNLLNQSNVMSTEVTLRGKNEVGGGGGFLTRDIKSSWLDDKDGHAAKRSKQGAAVNTSLVLQCQIEGASDQ